MDVTTFLWILTAVIGVFGIGALLVPAKGKDSKRVKNWMGAIFVIVALLVVAYQMNVFAGVGLGTPTALAVVPATPSSPTNPVTAGACGYQPTGSYSAVDKFSSTSVSGTSYYKANGEKASTTAISNLNRDVDYTYWVSNTTYYVEPITLRAGCGVNTFQAKAVDNSSTAPSISGWDEILQVATTLATTTNKTVLGANGVANVKVTYQGVAKKGALPFGGVAVYDYPNTISSVTLNGDSVLASNPYHLTYSTTTTSHTSKQWGISSSLDDGTGNPHLLYLQIKNSATTLPSNITRLKFYPANHYVTNAGDIVLDTEKFLNDDTSKTGASVNYLEISLTPATQT